MIGLGISLKYHYLPRIQLNFSLNIIFWARHVTHYVFDWLRRPFESCEQLVLAMTYWLYVIAAKSANVAGKRRHRPRCGECRDHPACCMQPLSAPLGLTASPAACSRGLLPFAVYIARC